MALDAGVCASRNSTCDASRRGRRTGACRVETVSLEPVTTALDQATVPASDGTSRCVMPRLRSRSSAFARASGSRRGQVDRRAVRPPSSAMRLALASSSGPRGQAGAPSAARGAFDDGACELGEVGPRVAVDARHVVCSLRRLTIRLFRSAALVVSDVRCQGSCSRAGARARRRSAPRRCPLNLRMSRGTWWKVRVVVRRAGPRRRSWSKAVQRTATPWITSLTSARG